MQRIAPIAEAEWEATICEFNKNMLKDFLENSAELSPKSLKAYKSNLRIWFVWVRDNLGNKEQIAIKPLEFKRFQNWLINRGCSSADITNKRAAISSLNNYIEVYYQDDYPTFRNFINKSIKRPPKAFVHEKQPLTKAELANMVKVLEEKGEWQKLAYLQFTFATGCRRAESRQLTKNTILAEPTIKKKTTIDENGNEIEGQIVTYLTKPIRCKGAGEAGKVRRLVFDQAAMDALKKWIEVRGGLDADDCPYMFVTKQGGKYGQVSETCFNTWAKSTFEPILGRRFHPHILRESRASQAVIEEGKDIHAVQKLLGHESSETTEIYVIRNDDDDVDDLF